MIDLRPRIPESFCVVVKDDNERECYAWNAYSYFFGHKNPAWGMSLGSYIAEVELRSGNARATSKFLIKNTGTRSTDIRIERIEN